MFSKSFLKGGYSFALGVIFLFTGMGYGIAGAEGKADISQARRKVVILKPHYEVRFFMLNQERQDNDSHHAQLKVELFSDYRKEAEPVPTGWIYEPIPTGWRSQPIPTGWLYAPIPTGWRSQPVPTGWRYEVEWEFVNAKVAEVPMKQVASTYKSKAALTSTKIFSFQMADQYLLKLRFYLRTGAKHRFLAHESMEKVNIEK